MNRNRGEVFMQAMRDGQQRLAEAPDNLRQIASVLSDFGRSLEEFSGGRVGVACVTRDGHQPIPGDFTVGIPMSIILVSHAVPGTPSPIVADLQISQFGFPVVFTFKGSKHSAFREGVVSDLLASLADSDVFASALHALMHAEAPVYQS